jgi:hypothetical protein
MVSPRDRCIGLGRLVLALTAVALLGGCAALAQQQARETEKLLAAAGFDRVPAERAAIAPTRPREMAVQNRNGKSVFVYADPGGCGCVYIGGAQEYARYREFAVSDAIARDTSIGAANSASTNGPSWAIWDPVWAPTDAWADSR